MPCCWSLKCVGRIIFTHLGTGRLCVGWSWQKPLGGLTVDPCLVRCYCPLIDILGNWHLGFWNGIQRGLPRVCVGWGVGVVVLSDRSALCGTQSGEASPWYMQWCLGACGWWSPSEIESWQWLLVAPFGGVTHWYWPWLGIMKAMYGCAPWCNKSCQKPAKRSRVINTVLPAQPTSPYIWQLLSGVYCQGQGVGIEGPEVSDLLDAPILLSENKDGAVELAAGRLN